MRESGSCLCGQVSYEAELSGDDKVINCHCTICQRLAGAPFMSFIMVGRESFKWVSGENDFTRYQSSDDGSRAFCKRCGSQVPVFDSNYDCWFVFPTNLHHPLKHTEVSMHIFTDSAQKWHKIGDDAVQYPDLPD